MRAPNTSRNPWIAHRPSTATTRSRLRLFCFPFAGGNAGTYRSWVSGLPEEIEVLPVELPGRASRFREAAFDRLEPLVEALAAGLEDELREPYAFFGHSMGALISFELARHLRRAGKPGPLRLLVSARRAAHLAPREEPIHDLPEPEFVDRLRRLNGTPEEVLAHPELMEMVLPLLRADFAVNETYVFREEPPLDVALSALGGLGDEDISREHLEGWKRHATGDFTLRMFPGDHFYLDRVGDQLRHAVAQDLLSLLPG